MNLRPLRPERSALAKLSYSPVSQYAKYSITNTQLQPILRLTLRGRFVPDFTGCRGILQEWFALMSEFRYSGTK